MLYAIALLQALTVEERALQKDLLDAAQVQMTERMEASKLLLKARHEAWARYMACADSQRIAPNANRCDAEYTDLRAAAIKVEVSLMGSRFERASVEKYLAKSRVEAADRVLGRR